MSGHQQEERRYFEGLLDQKDGKWSKHWGVLKDGWLLFYKDRSMQQVVSSVLVNSRTTIKVGKTKPPNSYQFLVRGDGSFLRLRCNTTQERSSWIEEIGRCARGELPAQNLHQHQVSGAPQHRSGQLPQPPTPGGASGPPSSGQSSRRGSEGIPQTQSVHQLPRRRASEQVTSFQDRSPLQQQMQQQQRMQPLRRPQAEEERGSKAAELPKKTTAPPPLPGEEAADLRKFSWFFGTMSREKSEDIIKAGGAVGSFIIRQSESSNNSFSLSFMDEERIRHYLVAQQANGRYALAGLENMSFRSVPELVDYYIEVNDGWAKPLNRTEFLARRQGDSASTKRLSFTHSQSAALAPAPPTTSKPTATQPSVRSPGGPQSSAGGRPGPVRHASEGSAPPPANAPPPPASKRPVLKRGNSDLDARTRSIAQQQQKEEVVSRRSASVVVGRPGGQRHGGLEQAPPIGLSNGGRTAAHFQDMRRQQLFPESAPGGHGGGDGRPHSHSGAPSNPSVPARSAVSLAQQRLSYHNVARGQRGSHEQDEQDEQEDYISTDQLTPASSSYINQQIDDDIQTNSEVLHDYLDLQECMPALSPSPTSPSSLISPTSSIGSACGTHQYRSGGSNVPPPPKEAPPADVPPFRPPKPGGRSSPLYDAVA